MAKWEDNLMELFRENTAPTYAELIARAKQIRPIRTNPASYKDEELELPLLGEFHD